MRIGIFTEANEEFRSVADITFPVMEEYCARHGYEWRPAWIEQPERSIVWDRIPRLRQGLHDCDWVVHLDADCLITNLHVPLTEFMDGHKHLVISRAARETGGMFFNDGFLMMRKTLLVDWILEDSWKVEGEEEGILCLQDALELMYGARDSVRSAVSVQPQKRFNSFLYPEYGMPWNTPGNWTPGDFILHLPGCTNARRVEIFTELEGRILR